MNISADELSVGSDTGRTTSAHALRTPLPVSPPSPSGLGTSAICSSSKPAQGSVSWGSQLVVTGYASHQSDIHAFSQALRQTELFDTVVQQSSEPKTLRGERWLEFVLVLSSRQVGTGLTWEQLPSKGDE